MDQEQSSKINEEVSKAVLPLMNYLNWRMVDCRVNLSILVLTVRV